MVVAFVIWFASQPRITPWTQSPGAPGSKLAHVVEEVPGGNCDWGGARFLFVNHQQYLLDAGDGTALSVAAREGVHVSIHRHASLPPDALYTGWHDDEGSQLWVAPSLRVDGSYQSVFIVAGSDVTEIPEFPIACE